MDDNLQDLEAELGRLRPAAPGPGLLARLEGDLAPGRRRWAWTLVPAACALAAAAVAGLHWRGRPPAPAPSPSLRPVSVQDVLVASRDEGYILLADGWPAHRRREDHIDTITWRDPRSASSLEWSVAREEIRIVPVSFQ